MPRFYFHVHDNMDVPDQEGWELPSLAVAHLKAIKSARDLASDTVRQGRLSLNHRIDIEDDAGAILLTVTFGEAVEVNT